MSDKKIGMYNYDIYLSDVLVTLVKDSMMYRITPDKKTAPGLLYPGLKNVQQVITTITCNGVQKYWELQNRV